MRLTANVSSIPSPLLAAAAPASAIELAEARAVRLDFLPSGWPEPYLNPLVRAFRLVQQANSYMEVGSRDKGHLAWIATNMRSGSTIADVDEIQFADNERLFHERFQATHKLVRVVSPPADAETPGRITNLMPDMRFDLIFANFATYYNDALTEYLTYLRFVAPGGFLIVNDAYWEGDGTRKGKCQALSMIAAKTPIYCVHMDEPLHLFTPSEQVGGEWGTLAIIQRT